MNLDQQKKQARELLRAIRAGNEDAVSRLRRHHSRWTTSDEPTVRQLVALHDAQFVLAREQGFASWPKLKAYAEPSSRSRHTRLFVADVEWITDRVPVLLPEAKDLVSVGLLDRPGETVIPVKEEAWIKESMRDHTSIGALNRAVGSTARPVGIVVGPGFCPLRRRAIVLVVVDHLFSRDGVFKQVVQGLEVIFLRIGVLHLGARRKRYLFKFSIVD